MEFVPVGRADVVSVAEPAESVAVPMRDDPLKKLTEPVGVVVPLAGLTETRSVKDVFCVMLVADGVSVVVVLTALGAGGLTVIAMAPDVEDLKVLVPA